jgi:hypothetical protein
MVRVLYCCVWRTSNHSRQFGVFVCRSWLQLIPLTLWPLLQLRLHSRVKRQPLLR